MLNIVPRLSEARQPRAIVKIGGTVTVNGVDVVTPVRVMPGWIDWEVDNNTFYQADTFRVSFATSALLADSGEDWFSQQQQLDVEIMAGFPADAENYSAADLKTLIVGRADSIEFDPVSRVIHLDGRDLTAQMIDAVTTEGLANYTASEIAKQIAAKYGLGTANITDTSTKVGKFYEIDHALMNDRRSEWDLLTYLAQMEQFVVYVSGRELYFHPETSPNAEPYLLQWQADPYVFNGKRLSFSRDLTVAKGIQVTVRSWNQRSGLVQVQYPTKAHKHAQQYVYRFANLDAAKALQKAQALHKERTQHEVKLHAEMPADDVLTVRNIIKAAGTGTAYDQLYYPDSIRRRMSIGEGYTMSISAKNHSPQTQVSS